MMPAQYNTSSARMKSVMGELTLPSAPLTGAATLIPPSCKQSYITIPPLLCSTVKLFHPIKVHKFPLKSEYAQQINLPRKFFVLAAPSDDRSNDGDEKNDPSSKDEGGIEEDSKNNGDRVDGSSGGNGRPRVNLKWVKTLLDPDPDNIVAVGLTGLLAWASVQVLWQLFVISVAILLAALKYSFVAALLIFILIALL